MNGREMIETENSYFAMSEGQLVLLGGFTGLFKTVRAMRTADRMIGRKGWDWVGSHAVVSAWLDKCQEALDAFDAEHPHIKEWREAKYGA